MSEVKMSEVIMSEVKLSQVIMSEVKMSEVIKMSETKIAEVFVSGFFRNRMQVIMQTVKCQVYKKG